MEDKRILVLGSNSYVGSCFKSYIEGKYTGYLIDSISLHGNEWTNQSFSEYDSVFDCVGIAHVKETAQNRDQYYAINRDLAIAAAQKCKADGVQQFILLSSMAVYGIETGIITKSRIPNPVTAYGESKFEADCEISKLEDEKFTFACVRPPMVYGPACKGNYNRLRSFAIKSPVFPMISNQRSMIYIGNLCEFIRRLVDNSKGGIFVPQNEEYICTSDMVNSIAKAHGKNILLTPVFNPLIKRMNSSLINKVFASLTYEKSDLCTEYSFTESIRLTECGKLYD